MVQKFKEILENKHLEELKDFAEYLGLEFEDYLEFLHPDVDFDDYSR
jgi:signal recognition particle subunit SEC65